DCTRDPPSRFQQRFAGGAPPARSGARVAKHLGADCPTDARFALGSGEIVIMAGTQPSSRIAGLDFLRALAIVLVLVAHYPKAGFGLLTRALNFGWCGVDLFFVLSGYLIGGQLFA